MTDRLKRKRYNPVNGRLPMREGCPIEFDVHAMISCDDAPTLEATLHGQFDELRLNKVNYRKEFFRMPLERLREVVTGCGVEAS